MAHTIRSRGTSPANELRDSLDYAEQNLLQLGTENVAEFLAKLDRIEELFTTLPELGIDLRTEEVRWRNVQSRMQTNPSLIVRPAAEAGGLATLRSRRPDAEGFWWYLDQELAQRRRRSFTQLARTIGIVAAVLFVLLWGINTFFPPDPVAVQLTESLSNIDSLVMDQNWEEAMAAVQDGKEKIPEAEQGELLVWEAVLADRLGRPDQASAVLDRAQEILEAQSGSPTYFWILLGQKRLQVGDVDGADEAGQQALAVDPDSAHATFLLGGVAEARGDTAAAIDYFNQTFDLAQDDDPQLAVIARVRLGQLLQQPGNPFADISTPETPEPQIEIQ